VLDCAPNFWLTIVPRKPQTTKKRRRENKNRRVREAIVR
jgi:hypothetical protein